MTIINDALICELGFAALPRSTRDAYREALAAEADRAVAARMAEEVAKCDPAIQEEFAALEGRPAYVKHAWLWRNVRSYPRLAEEQVQLCIAATAEGAVELVALEQAFATTVVGPRHGRSDDRFSTA